jgi:hypothetical protein
LPSKTVDFAFVVGGFGVVHVPVVPTKHLEDENDELKSDFVRSVFFITTKGLVF